jgi:hypothetical protein
MFTTVQLFTGVFPIYLIMLADYSALLFTPFVNNGKPGDLHLSFEDIIFIYIKLSKIYKNLSKEITYTSGSLSLSLLRTTDDDGYSPVSSIFTCEIIKDNFFCLRLLPEPLSKFYQAIEIVYRPFIAGSKLSYIDY